MRRLPSASQQPRAFACPGSEKLPHMDAITDYGARGTAVHWYLENARKIGREAALVQVADDDARAMCAALPLDKLPAGGDYEVALAWDYRTDTARILPPSSHRDYSAVEPSEYVGTSDYLGKDGDELVVIDWKSGHKHLGSPRMSRQLRFLALAGARATGLDKVRAAYFYLREDGTYAPAWASFDALELAEIADELIDLVDEIEAAKPTDVSEGEHCDYCPAFNSCPAKITHALAIGNGEAARDLASVERQVATMTDAQLGAAYAKLDSFYEVAERVKKTIRKRAEVRDIPVGGKDVLGVMAWPYTVLNAKVALEVITERHGADVADATVPRSATLTAVKKLGTETLEEIERRGGVITGTKPQVRVHRKKENER